MTQLALDTTQSAQIPHHLRTQSQSCLDHDSPLCGALLEAALDDYEAGGVTARLLSDWEGHPTLDALSMRILGAVHTIVLEGRAPNLARHYPTAGGRPDTTSLARDFIETIEHHADEIRPRLDQQVQTNEVRRSAALLGGFLHVADTTGLPLALHEFGSSAGLNQHFDRHRYELGAHAFGRTDAELRLTSEWAGPAPALAAPLEVALRGGCDLSPVDLEDPVARARLESFIWGDQPERLERLRTAIAVAREHGTQIDRARAVDWLRQRLAEPASGLAHVVFNSSVWWYLPADERTAVTELIEAAGERATPETPLAWLRMEGDDLDFAELRVRVWPDGGDLHLGRTRYHGQSIEWF